MNLVKVYHANTSNNREFRLNLDFKRDDSLVAFVKENLDKYTLVANPIQESVLINHILEDAYNITNSYEEAWYNNFDANATELASKGCRSTSVGDIIEFAGVKYVVDGFGFKCLED